MKLKQQVELTDEEALKVLSKIIESKTKKKVVKSARVERPDKGVVEKVYVFELEDGVVEDTPKA